jgi:hypothetical protein
MEARIFCFFLFPEGSYFSNQMNFLLIIGLTSLSEEEEEVNDNDDDNIITILVTQLNGERYSKVCEILELLL